MRASHTFTVTHIDGYIDDGSLANMFGNKCDHLYNGVSYNTNGKIYIKTNIVLWWKKTITRTLRLSTMLLMQEHLHYGKTSGEEGSYSDYVIHTPHLSHRFLSLLFNSSLILYITLDSMIVLLIVSILK